MKYVHWVAYPILILIIAFLAYSSLYQALELDGAQQSLVEDQSSIDDLLRYVSVNSNCDTTPQQLSAEMGKGYDLTENSPNHKGPAVAHLAFLAKYEGRQLVGIEVVDRGSVALCGRKRSIQ